MLNFTHQILSWNLVWRLIACKRGVLGLKLYTFYKAHCCAKILGYVSCVMVSLLQPANEVWGKVIFSEVCVKNSVHGRGIPACLAGHMTNQQGGACSRGVGAALGGCLLREGYSRGCLLRGVCSRGACSRGACSRGGACLVATPPGRLLLRAVHILLECILVPDFHDVLN